MCAVNCVPASTLGDESIVVSGYLFPTINQYLNTLHPLKTSPNCSFFLIRNFLILYAFRIFSCAPVVYCLSISICFLVFIIANSVSPINTLLSTW